jgi:serine/threonine protein kinase
MSESPNPNRNEDDGLNEMVNAEPELLSIEAEILSLSRDYSNEKELERGLRDAKRLISEFRNLEPGDCLSHFQLLKLLRKGGHGQVWSATDTRTGHGVAIKILNSIWSSTNKVRNRLQREAELLCQCKNPNLVTIQEAGVEGSIPFFVMELLDGQDLSRIVHRIGPLQYDIAATIGYEIANGLSGLSELGIIHRDIKPSNIMLTTKGVVKIIDLGVGSQSGQSGQALTDLTQTEEFLGSVEFMAPEQAFDPKHADTRSDLYSLGCTLYFLLVGKPPFDSIGDSTVLKRALAHASQPFPSITEQSPDVPTRLAKVIDHLVSKSPKDRPKSPSEVKNLLKPFVNHDRTRMFAESHERIETVDNVTANLKQIPSRRKELSIAKRVLLLSIVCLALFGGAWGSGLLNRQAEQIVERFPEATITEPKEGFYLGTNHNESAGRKDGMGLVFSGDLAVYLPPYSKPEAPMPFGVIWVRNREHALTKRGFIVYERPVDDRDILVIEQCDGSEFSARYIYASTSDQVAAFDKPGTAKPHGTLNGLWQNSHVILKQPDENASVALRKVWRELLKKHAPESVQN